MTIYEKPNKDIFAADAPSSEIRPFTAWLRGLGIAFDETNGFPEMGSFNGLLQALSIYIKYLEQRGLAEWRNDLEYPAGAGVQVGLSWYRAKRQNINSAPATSQDDWELLVNASALSYTAPLYIENNVIKIKDATSSSVGVTRYATQQEVQTGAKVNAAVTPEQAFSLSFGTNQTIIDYWVGGNSGSERRFTNTPYKNNTGRTITVFCRPLVSGNIANNSIKIKLNGITILDYGSSSQGAGDRFSATFIVPAGFTYEFVSLDLPSQKDFLPIAELR